MRAHTNSVTESPEVPDAGQARPIAYRPLLIVFWAVLQVGTLLWAAPGVVGSAARALSSSRYDSTALLVATLQLMLWGAAVVFLLLPAIRVLQSYQKADQSVRGSLGLIAIGAAIAAALGLSEWLITFLVPKSPVFSAGWLAARSPAILGILVVSPLGIALAALIARVRADSYGTEH